MLLSVVAILFSAATFSQVREKNLLSQIKAKAKLEVENYLQLIPEGQESEYGFTTRAEFGSVQIGEPYLMTMLYRSDENLMVLETNEYRVPLMVDNHFVALLTIKSTVEGLEVLDFGAARLARELQKFESEHPGIQDRVVLRNTVLGRDYLTPSYASLKAANVSSQFPISNQFVGELYDINNLQQSVSIREVREMTPPVELK